MRTMSGADPDDPGLDLGRRPSGDSVRPRRAGRGQAAADGRIWLIAGLALFALAAITAIVSYLHALAVVRSVGNTGAVAYLIPFVADLMIVSASMVLLEAARNSAIKPALAIVSLVFGIGATLAMNVAAGWHHGSAGALVAALPPVALVLSLETLLGLVRRSREFEVPRDDGRAGPQPGQCPHQVAMTADDAVVSAYLHGRHCDGDAPSQRQLAAQFGVSRARVAALIGSLNGNGDPSALQAQVAASTYTG
jgi:hypothetical protein